LAQNYNSIAIENDGSCLYANTSVNLSWSVNIDFSVNETSALWYWNDQFWSMNDNSDTHFYQIDTLTGTTIQSSVLPTISNIDWEEIQQDSEYFYIGDFGNNNGGNRTDLKIYRLAKSTYGTTNQIDTIRFSYPEQTDFSSQIQSNIIFDCEAFIVSQDSIFLFTKSWALNKSLVYSLPTNPGTHEAHFKDTLPVGGLITGAHYDLENNRVTLSGYNTILSPFVYLLFDFEAFNFLKGNKRKIAINASYHQIEGITSLNGIDFFLTNEAFTYGTINTPAKISKLNLSTFYAEQLEIKENIQSNTLLYAENGLLTFPNKYLGKQLLIIGMEGKIHWQGTLIKNELNLDTSGYFIVRLF
jgi:hypothetical protein